MRKGSHRAGQECVCRGLRPSSELKSWAGERRGSESEEARGRSEEAGVGVGEARGGVERLGEEGRG